MTLKVHSLHNVARLYHSTPEKVRKAILALYDSRPPFSYEQLYDLVWASLKLKEPIDELRQVVASWRPSVRKDSYLRALGPTGLFFSSFARNYDIEVLPRLYSIGRGLQAPFAPRMLFGTDKGSVVPYLIFWKVNRLTEEQLALLHGMAADAFSADPDLDRAKLMLVDTSKLALDDDGRPAVLVGDEIPIVSAEKMREMLEVFAEGFEMAKQVIDKRSRVRPSKRSYDDASEVVEKTQDLFSDF